jgi:hypothetical protein
MTALPLAASLTDLLDAVETDPSWSLCPFSRDERRTYLHATATMTQFFEKVALRVDIPAADYAGPATVDRMRLDAIRAINSARTT